MVEYGFFGALITATGLRLWRDPQDVLADIRDHSRGVDFFTIVAACGVFGNQLLLHGHVVTPVVLIWGAAAVLWFVLMYGLLTRAGQTTSRPQVESRGRPNSFNRHAMEHHLGGN